MFIDEPPNCPVTKPKSIHGFPLELSQGNPFIDDCDFFAKR